MAGYNPNDSEEKRAIKAAYFFKSMMQKGQPRNEAIQIASRYYHVKEDNVLNITEREEDKEDGEVWFLLDGCIAVEASEIFDPGDFH